MILIIMFLVVREVGGVQLTQFPLVLTTIVNQLVLVLSYF